MNNRGLSGALLITVLAAYLLPIDSLSCLERQITISGDGDLAWQNFTLQERLDLTPGKLEAQDLILKDNEYSPQAETDLLVHFNSLPFREETGNFLINVPNPVISNKTAVFGKGSAAFHKDLNAIRLVPKNGSLFNRGGQDFTIELWAYAANMSDGEVLLSWNGTRSLKNGVREEGGDHREQVIIQELVLRIKERKLKWEFKDFFLSDTIRKFEITGIKALLPRSWHHHLVRFDSSTGLLEYTVDGIPEGIIYATDTLGDGGTVLKPATDTNGSLILGNNFTGLIDELKISGLFSVTPHLKRYSDQTGTWISSIIDFEYSGSLLKRIDAEYNRPADTEIYFYYRMSNEKKHARELAAAWIPFIPTRGFNPSPQGRFIQLMVELLPDGTRMHSPVLSGLIICYEPDLPPLPPSHLLAEAGSRTVTLSWRPVNEKDVAGYRIYYGNTPGNYMGAGCLEGDSPIDVGQDTRITLTGLEDGKLYYFAVVAYDRAHPPHQSAFSVEVSARPSRIQH